MTKHTPSPWRVFDGFADIEIVADHPAANGVESLVQFKGQRNPRANAEFIVRACNTHHDVVAALEIARAMLAHIQSGGSYTCAQWYEKISIIDAAAGRAAPEAGQAGRKGP